MKITDITFGMLRVPLKTPFKTALRTVDTVEDIVVIVHTDTGHVGYGEAPATAVITGDTHGSIIEAIAKFIRPRLIGQEIANLNRITDLVQTAIERNTVRVVLDDGKIEARRVKLGARNRIVAQVLEGLQPGERVLTSERAAGGAREASAARTPKMGPRL